MDASNVAVQALLLQEAQAEIASLRTDLYTYRRQAEDRRQAISALTTAKDQLTAQVESLEGELAKCRSQISVYQGIDEQLVAMREANATLQREVEMGMNARKILEGELSSERKDRQVGVSTWKGMQVKKLTSGMCTACMASFLSEHSHAALMYS